MNFGEKLKELRTSKGLTQIELSEKSGIALRTVQRIERNEVKPSIYSLKALGNILEVDFSTLIATEGHEKFEIKIRISNITQFVEDVKTLFRRNWKILFVLLVFVYGLINYENIIQGIILAFDPSSVTVKTINCELPSECDIEIVKKDKNGKILWKKTLGGTSYDKAGQVVRTKAGDYLVVGSTSSFGKGNYDVLLIKLNSSGEVQWQKTYGDFLNDYGYKIAPVADSDEYMIEGTKQFCNTVNVSNNCIDQVWEFKIDADGNLK